MYIGSISTCYIDVWLFVKSTTTWDDVVPCAAHRAAGTYWCFDKHTDGSHVTAYVTSRGCYDHVKVYRRIYLNFV